MSCYVMLHHVITLHDRRAAQGATSRSGVASRSGVGTDATSGVPTDGSDIFDFARNVADDISRSGVGMDGASAVSGRSRKARSASGARSHVSSGLPSISEAGILEDARRVAAEISVSGVGTRSTVAGASGLTDLFGKTGPARPRPRQAASASGVSSGLDIFGVADRAAEGVSQSGVGMDSEDGGMSDIIGMARQAAADASVAGPFTCWMLQLFDLLTIISL